MTIHGHVTISRYRTAEFASTMAIGGDIELIAAQATQPVGSWLVVSVHCLARNFCLG